MRDSFIPIPDNKEVIKQILNTAIDKATIPARNVLIHGLKINNKHYNWSTNIEKIAIIRKGLPYAAIENLSNKMNIPVKHYLESFEIVQTTYNKKKRANESLSKQDSEFIVELTELYTFGENVFNNETDKFQRWLKKQNISLGNIKPYSMFDSLVGINEVKKALNRLEYGNMA